MALKIPVTIITGFLGAGKTSLIRHLAITAVGKRIAFIINEFGDLGIDRAILEGCGIKGCSGDDIVELANGCLCCTVADDFLPAIERLLDRPAQPEHILIETSGLALPKPLVQAFNWPMIRQRLTVDGVIAVVDANSLASGLFVENSLDSNVEATHDNPIAELFEDQLAIADLVILNKTETFATKDLENLRLKIAHCTRPMVKTMIANHGRVAPEIVIGLDAAAEGTIDDLRTRHDEANHDHDDFTSFVLSFGKIENLDVLRPVLEIITNHPDVLRIKGFVTIANLPRRCLIQAVGARLDHSFDRSWQQDEKRTSSLVVIGRTGLSKQDLIRDIEKLVPCI